MPTRVDQAVTEVFTEPEPATANVRGDVRWEEEEPVRQLIKRVQELNRRTCAEGFDD